MNTTTGGIRDGRSLPVVALLVGVALAAVTVFAVTPRTAWAGQQFVRVLSSTQTVSVKSEANGGPIAPAVHKDANGNPMANLKAARNEFESFQVYVKADAGGIANLRVDPGEPLKQIDPVTGNPIVGGDSIPAKNLTFYREEFINIGDDENLLEIASDYPEGGEGEWADALIPETDYIYNEDRKAFPHTVPANGRAVAWVDILVPENQPAGTYQGTILVKNDAGAAAVQPGQPARGTILGEPIPVRIEVKNFKIPSTSTLGSAFMQNHQYRNPCGGYAPSMCDTPEEKWRLFSQYARVGLENRMSIPSPWGMGGLNDAPPTALESHFKTYALPLINGMKSSLEYGNPGQSRLNAAQLTSVAAYEGCVEFSDTCLPAWKTLAERHNFKDRFFLYACDEPGPPDPDKPHLNRWPQCMSNAEEARSVDPSIRTLITSPPQRLAAYGDISKVDMSAPVVNHVDGYDCCGNPFTGNQRYKPAYTDFLDPAKNPAGTALNELWPYTSNMSFGGPDDDPNVTNHRLTDGWPGYAIDQPDTQARAMGWMSFYYDFDGELYWQNTQTHSRAWTNQYEQGGNGDGNLFYPGLVLGDAARGVPAIGGTHDIPIESIRLKKIRDGREDYEYMNILKEQNKTAQAKAIIGSAYPNGYGNQDYVSKCADTVARPTSPDGGCGASAMYTTISGEKMEAARLQLMNLVNPEEPGNTCQGVAVTVAGATDGSETIEGTAGNDVINGLGGDDTINGLEGNDKICGGAGFDTVSGGLHDDSLEGEALEYGRSATGVSVDLAALRATGEGTDTLLGADFSEVYGSPQADTITGNDKNNYLVGIDGNDDLVGSGGDDVLRGDAGDDSINSREGASDKGLWAPPLAPYTERYGILCGAGTDSVVADAQEQDTANADCETVDRPGPIDITPPTGEVKINNGAASTRDRAVVLNLSATDPDPGSGVAQMRLSHNGETWTPWQTYAAKRKWTLKKGKSGVRLVYAQFKDGSGIESVEESDTIRYRR